MAGARNHEQPGTMPGPRRARPRGGGQDSADVGREAGDVGREAGDGTLAWSVAAMSDAQRRLARASAANVPQAAAAATEAAWWVTVVDAAMTRHHPDAYARALADLDPAARKAVEGSLAGLRFIRGQLGYSADPGDFIQPGPAPGPGPAAQWTWSAVSPPPQRRGSARDASPYREYRAHLAGRPVAETLGRAVGFLVRAHATATRPGHRTTPSPPGMPSE
jgi:hypothetical protein